MEPFQKLVQESLDHAQYYWYHPTDFNIAQSNAHLFTLRRDADFICGDPYTGRIFWVEAKSTKGNKFYPMHSKSNARQFHRALEIDSYFSSFFYIVNFYELDIVSYFNPSLIHESKSFGPNDYPDLQVTHLTQEKKDLFGKVRSHHLLDLSFLTELLSASLGAEK
jgi:hypothetical protein